MNLGELAAALAPAGLGDMAIPHWILGSFRRKSITFFDGTTDERTVVYWFQSRSFSIDLRLPDGNDTALTDRQGWIGTTMWDAQAELLSWDVRLGYQPRIQWPEPAKLYPIGNSILEFAPSHAYVEDWRQQSNSGILLGLRLVERRDERNGARHDMDGGLIVAGEHVAYVLSRPPAEEVALQGKTDLALALARGAVSAEGIESYEVSIAIGGTRITCSTQRGKVGQQLDLDGFAIELDGRVSQVRWVAGVPCTLLFEVDVFAPYHAFGRQTDCTAQARQWMSREKGHLSRNAVVAH